MCRHVFQTVKKTGLIARRYDALAEKTIGQYYKTPIGLYQQALQRPQDIPFNGLFCIECHRW
jgi:hypothetical protein